MIQDSILDFEEFRLEQGNVSLQDEAEYDLLTSASGFMDTWGPGQFHVDSSIDCPSLVSAITIGGGLIQASNAIQDRYHWAQGTRRGASFTKPFKISDKILIGAGMEVRINDRCQIDEIQCWLDSAEQLDSLGPHECTWESTEKQAGIKLGKGVKVEYVQTYAKLPGQNLKQFQLGLEDKLLLPFLQAPWGLQVSFCTGISRRVPLCELVADLMPAFVESFSLVPQLRPTLRDDYHIHDAFRNPGLQEWLGNLPEDSQELI
jgi:hypothetical protein